METSFIVVTWENVEELSLRLGSLLRHSFIPDLIVGVARGGWIVARLLSDYLDVSNIASIRVEFYEKIGEHRSKPIITQPLSAEAKDLNVLVVDDVADSGSSLLEVKKHVQEKGAKIVKTATLHLKPWSKIKPDFYVEVVSGWVIYPWELRETIRNLMEKWKKEKLTKDQLIEKLVSIGLKKYVVEKLVEDLRVD